MAKIISVTNSKGGSGKSTITIFLASVFSKLGNRVLVADCDEQSTIIAAHKVAEDLGDEILFDVVAFAADSKSFFDELEKVSNTYDFIFIDMPGRGHDIAVKNILYSIDYAIIPMGYGDSDVLATQEFINDLLSVKKDLEKNAYSLDIAVFFNNLKHTKKSEDVISSFMSKYEGINELHFLKNKKGDAIILMNRDIYKTLDFGHTPLELSKNFKTKSTILEFEDFVASVLNFIK